MSEYKAVADELAAGTPAEMICAACPWDRLCVKPPSMSSAEVKRQIAQAEAKDRGRGPKAPPLEMLVTALAVGGRDSMGELCPVFALRLRTDRQVADAVRDVMRGYGEGR